MSVDWVYIKYILRQTKRYKKRREVPEILYYEALVLNEYMKDKLMYESQYDRLSRWLSDVDINKLNKNTKLSMVHSRELNNKKSIRALLYCLLSYLPCYIVGGICYCLSGNKLFIESVLTSPDLLGWLIILIYVCGLLNLIKVKEELAVSEYDLTYPELLDLDMRLLRKDK